MQRSKTGIVEIYGKENLSGYLNPQECGNRTGVRTLSVHDDMQHGLTFQKASAPFEMSVFHHSRSVCRLLGTGGCRCLCCADQCFFICVALGAGVGAGVLVSRYFGAKNYGKMKTIVSTSLLSFLVLSVVLGVFGFSFSRAMMSGLQAWACLAQPLPR